MDKLKLDYSPLQKILFSTVDDNMRANYVEQCIRERIEKLNKKQEEINNLTYERQLIADDIVDCIKGDLSSSAYNIMRYFREDALWMSWKYVDAGELATDEEASCYKVVLKVIKDNLIPEKYKDKVELKNIMAFNLPFQEFEFIFELEGHQFIISVPDFRQTSENNYLDMLAGYKLKTESNHEVSTKFSHLDYRKFREALEEWLDEEIK